MINNVKGMRLLDYEGAHREFIRKSLGECTVLLRSNGDFPLGSPCKVALFGNGARHTVKGGTGSGEVNSRGFVSIEDGLKANGFEITTEEWLSSYDEIYKSAKKDFIKKIKREARRRLTLAPLYGMGKVMPEPEYTLPLDYPGDVAVFVLSRISGEGSDREAVKGDILLTDTEKDAILYLNGSYKKFILVLNVGGVIDLSPLGDVKNILLLSQLGDETGNGLAEILTGKQYPSGKLTDTWAAYGDYPPMADFGDLDDTRYREGILVGYRYFSTADSTPVFPFGHGLSYTKFDIEFKELTQNEEGFTLTAKASNIGKRCGKEVIQIYVSKPQSSLPKPSCELCGFAKTEELTAGESRELDISFTYRDISSYDSEKRAYVLEQGEYIIYLGSSVADKKPVAVIEMPEDVSLLTVNNLCGRADFTDYAPIVCHTEQTGHLTRVRVDSSLIEPRIQSYEMSEHVSDFVRTLDDTELAYLNVGRFSSRGGIISVIGNASKSVAGAAGETAAHLKNRGIAPIVMADGPSGVRVSPRFYRDGKGVHPIGQGGIPESIGEYLPKALRGILNSLVGKNTLPRGANEENHYATAMPIPTAVAQSWNVNLAYKCGAMVGDEMKRFGVHLWLAPALNIHRTIRCGRNFEYYSEDPLISGKIAAAVSRGVRSAEGCGVTLKHYAANNRETNRYGNNSIVSERAMREIYLRAFEIAVKEGKPYAVMTSYNLLNGTHTAEHSGICRDILRCEWGFDGLIMTDWVVCGSIMARRSDKHPKVRPYLVAKAGGDLFMPGCSGDVKSILRGLEKGELSREQLQKNATRVCNFANLLNK